MDKDFESKIKRKKIRNIVIILLVVAFAIYFVMDMTIEKKGDKVLEPVAGESTVTVSMEIRCDSLSEDISKLQKKELVEYVPDDGTILEKTEVEIPEGSSAFDVLNKICREKDIQVESSYTPTYKSYYVEGINYLYEFDAGAGSGWMYKVNEEFPSVGASSYEVKDGDYILWQYTCDLGADVGNEYEE